MEYDLLNIFNKQLTFVRQLRILIAQGKSALPFCGDVTFAEGNCSNAISLHFFISF